MESAPQIRALGARTVIIGNGSIEALGEFAERYSAEVDFFTDPGRLAYEALGMLYGMGGWNSFKMLSMGIRAHRAGFRQGRTEGHPLQQGGVFLFDQSGDLILAHRDTTAGDHLPPDRILDVLGKIGK